MALVDVSAFTVQARTEFMDGMMAAEQKSLPANYEPFVTKMASKTLVETHLWMSNLPRLKEFKGYVPFAKLSVKGYTVTNKEWRVGVEVPKVTIDDDQAGGYLKQINGLPKRAQEDAGHQVLSHLVAGTSNTCFDGSAFFASSHTIGSGDNLDTANSAGSSDGTTHYMIGLVLTNTVVKPVVYQDREPMTSLQTDADTPQAALAKDYKYWVDGRFGLAYGYWWDAYHLTITDTPDLSDCMTHLDQMVSGLRTFTLPKGDDADTALYVHENWVPDASNFYVLCNMKLGQKLQRLATAELVAAGTSGATITNTWQKGFTVIPTGALGA